MGLPKGMTNNPAGRTPGSKNKATIEIREKLNDYLINNFDEFTEACKKLPEKDFVNVFRDLMKFAIPMPQPEPIAEPEPEEKRSIMMDIALKQLKIINNKHKMGESSEKKIPVKKDYKKS